MELDEEEEDEEEKKKRKTVKLKCSAAYEIHPVFFYDAERMNNVRKKEKEQLVALLAIF
jgi:hypothetical protein